MNKSLQIDFQWEPASFGSTAEQATFASLSIVAGGEPATELEDLLAKTVRFSVRASGFHLAQWFAFNWWRLRWEPEHDQSVDWQMAHNVAAAGGGYVWPDLSFSSDGENILVRSRPTAGRPDVSVRYLNQFDIAIDAVDFEREIDAFMEAVTTRINGPTRQADDLLALWTEVLEERTNPELAKARKLEALLGCDPDTAEQTSISELLAEGEALGQDAVAEVAAYARTNANKNLRELRQILEASSSTLRVPPLVDLQNVFATKRYKLPWQRGVAVAYLARQVWDLQIDGALPDRTLAERFEFPAHLLSADDEATNVMTAALRQESEDCLVLHINKRPKTSRRFALARLIGDHLISRADRLLPITEAKTARQKFQRAFAQEFLCPFTLLRDFIGTNEPSDDDIEEAAGHFEVSPLLIRTTLVNHHLLGRRALEPDDDTEGNSQRFGVQHNAKSAS